MLALRVAQSVVPVTAMWIGKAIVDEAIHLSRTHGGARHLWLLVACEFGIVVAASIAARTSNLVETLLSDALSNHVGIMMMSHAATLDLARFEEPSFQDRLERARQGSSGRIALIGQLLTAVQDIVTVTSLAFALAVQVPGLMLLLTISILPSFLGEAHFAARTYSLAFAWTPERRELDYYRLLATSDKTAKEVQAFGLSDWLIERYRKLSSRYFEANRRLVTRKTIVALALSTVSIVAYYGAYWAILGRAIDGRITIGMLTFLAGSFQRSRDYIQRILLSVSGTLEQAQYLRDLFSFLDAGPMIRVSSGGERVQSRIDHGIVLENVGFRYPGTERWAVRGVSFSVAQGERIALVGENGAGKSTLTKLLARLYDPTEGRILLNGIDLREYDATSFRQAISVVFQDFVRYDMRLRDNIGVGNLDVTRACLEQPGWTMEEVGNTAIQSAADKAGAERIAAELSAGWDQMLGRRFDGGVELSGGQWQSIALSRAYIRDAKLIILDEPTASLDARAEFEVFRRFRALTEGRMAVLISHRFSTVRMADRILVLHEGRITEHGTHDELVERHGRYGELFGIQAAAYR